MIKIGEKIKPGNLDGNILYKTHIEILKVDYEKIIDLLAESGSHKDEKILDYVRRHYLINQKVTNICFITGVEDNNGIHKQIAADELRKLAFKKNEKNTIYFLKSFFFSEDWQGYTKVIEEMFENDIQIFKTDSKAEHLSSNVSWRKKYVTFLIMEDVEK